MIIDAEGNPRYVDKQYEQHAKPPSPELKALYREMAANPRFHISRENNFYPRGYPSQSPGWTLA
jgi:hypothetical protein